MRMKMQLLTLIGAAVIWSVAGAARADVQTIAVAQIPFAFTVNGTRFPAGTYDIQEAHLLDPDVLIIRGAHNDRSVIVDATNLPGMRHEAREKQDFVDVAGQRVLEQIRVPNLEDYRLPDSR